MTKRDKLKNVSSFISRIMIKKVKIEKKSSILLPLSVVPASTHEVASPVATRTLRRCARSRTANSLGVNGQVRQGFVVMPAVADADADAQAGVTTATHHDLDVVDGGGGDDVEWADHGG
jgi:hypothetical protein